MLNASQMLKCKEISEEYRFEWARDTPQPMVGLTHDALEDSDLEFDYNHALKIKVMNPEGDFYL